MNNILCYLLLIMQVLIALVVPKPLGLIASAALLTLTVGLDAIADAIKERR